MPIKKTDFDLMVVPDPVGPMSARPRGGNGQLVSVQGVQARPNDNVRITSGVKEWL
jgi:hypothetical protein